MSRIGRPPKYVSSSTLSINIPTDLKEFLKDLSEKTGRSISELVTEALINYYRNTEVKIKRPERRRRSIDLVRELETKRIERELELREKNVKALEKAIAQKVMYVKVGRATTVVWDAIIREQNCLHGLIKKCLGLERYGLDLYDYVKKAVELIERLEKIK